MMTREDYLGQYRAHEAMRKQVQEDQNRLHYHLMPPTGWLNDPNGLCEKDGTYHIYFQYSPYNSGWDTKLWGHYTTRDFLHFNEEEPFLFPDIPEDRDGVYSGSAVVADGVVHYYYTGNVKLHDREDYDYVNQGREQNTIHFTSRDGIEAGRKTVVLDNGDYPEDMSTHVRDPKVIKKDGVFYMLLGGRTRQDRGCVLVYRGRDPEQFTYCGRLGLDREFGYMWECPDYFELDGQGFLAVCPQGLKGREYEFENVYQSGYFHMEYDPDKDISSLGMFQEFDRGFDFYAPQTFEDEKGRRILMAWMGIPDADYHNGPTVKHGWQHCLTMPRVLTVRDGRLIQQPLEEMKQLRGTPWEGCIRELGDKAPASLCYEMEVRFDSPDPFRLQIREDAFFCWQEGVLSLELGACGCGRKSRHVRIPQVDGFTVFSDTSCLEIFVNGGQEVFTTRLYGGEAGQRPRFLTDNGGEVTYYPMGSYVIEAGVDGNGRRVPDKVR